MRRRRFLLLTLLLVWGLCEGVAAIGLALLRDRAPRPISATALVDEHRGPMEAMLLGGPRYITHSAALGWTISPGGSGPGCRADASGLRGGRGPLPEPPPGIVRVACFGDSFTHGDDVADGETWEASLERLEPRIEALNFGVPGYGTDQAYLRFRTDGAAFRSHVVVFGVLSENIHRVVNVFRPFYEPRSPLPLAKPRFVLAGSLQPGGAEGVSSSAQRSLQPGGAEGVSSSAQRSLQPGGAEGVSSSAAGDGGAGLDLLENPLPTLESYRALLDRPAETLARLGEHDHHFRTRSRTGLLASLPTVKLWRAAAHAVRSDGVIDPQGGGPGVPRYDVHGEAFEVLSRILERGAAEARARGAAPVVLLFPKRSDVETARRGNAAVYAPLVERLAGKGIAVCDLGPAFAAAAEAAGDMGPLFMPGGHYSPRGNALVAETLLAFLRERKLLDGK